MSLVSVTQSDDVVFCKFQHSLEWSTFVFGHVSNRNTRGFPLLLNIFELWTVDQIKRKVISHCFLTPNDEV